MRSESKSQKATKKQRTMEVPLFKKGDYVLDNDNKYIRGIVTRQSGIMVYINTKDRGTVSRYCINLKLLTKKEYEDMLPKELKVRSLAYRVQVLEGGRVKVGCQTMTAADAKAVAQFILKHVK